MILCLAYLALLFAAVFVSLARKGLLRSANPAARRRYDRVSPTAGARERPASRQATPRHFAAAWRTGDARSWTWGSAAQQPGYGPALLTLGFVLVDLSRLAVDPPPAVDVSWPAFFEPATQDAFFAQPPQAELPPLWNEAHHALNWGAEASTLEPAHDLPWTEASRPETGAHATDLGWFV
jgi:hypothetical protein